MTLWTNRGKATALDIVFRNAAEPTNFFLALFQAATAPTADTNVKGDLTELGNGNGYATGGQSLNRNSTDFDVLTEDDTNDRALVQIKDVVWTASGGNLGPARYAGLTDDNATQANRIVMGTFDLSSDRTVSDGQALTLQNCEFRLT